MSKRGRPELAIPTIEWKCRIPVDIAAKIDLLLLDPIRGVPVYGARSMLVTSLLRQWLALREKPVAVDTLDITTDN